jgi:transposase-like protein
MIRQHVVPASVIYTDEFPSYDGIKEFSRRVLDARQDWNSGSSVTKEP